MDLSDFFIEKAVFHNLFSSMNKSNSSVPITATFGTRHSIVGYSSEIFDSDSKLFANASPLALPPNEPDASRTKFKLSSLDAEEY
jgi:hypothetical protein